MSFEPKDPVARYYDANTRQFLTLGHGASSHTIHRAVWGPGVRNREEAMHYVHDLLLRDIAADGIGEVLDLGCGVGGSLLYIGERSSCRLAGITISRVQAEIGVELVERSGQAHRCRIVHGDFLDPRVYDESLFPPAAGATGGGSAGRAADRSAGRLAFGIESFLHVPDAELFFKTLAKELSSGDLLILCDDFLAGDPEIPSKRWRRMQRWLAEFRRGWKVGSLFTADRVGEMAGAAGFRVERREDLTSYLELDRPRDIGIRAMVALGRPFPFRGEWWSNFLGGNALQLCIKNGLVRYLYIVMRRL